jgi:histone H3/H4
MNDEQFASKGKKEKKDLPEMQIAREKSLIVKTNIRESSEFSVSEEFLEAIDKKVEQILREAESRAKANSRRTLYARDL